MVAPEQALTIPGVKCPDRANLIIFDALGLSSFLGPLFHQT